MQKIVVEKKMNSTWNKVFVTNRLFRQKLDIEQHKIIRAILSS